MNTAFPFSEFVGRFPDDSSCLEEIKKLAFPRGVFCQYCQKITKHYKVRKRTAYSCTFCRNHIYPLAGTIFEKTTTPLRLWFYALFLMTHTRATITISDLQKELGVTYKTAWRMYHHVKMFMEQNNADLLTGTMEYAYGGVEIRGKGRIRRWTFFNRIEFTVVNKKEPSG